MFSIHAVADQRFETVGGFCHFVLNPDNDDNAVSLSNCANTIVQNDDGTGDGSTRVTVKYNGNYSPLYETLVLSGKKTGIDCVMVDSNGTSFVTRDWNSSYVVKVKDLKEFKAAFGSDNEEFDLNNDGIVDYADLTLFRARSTIQVNYTLICRNAAQE